MTAGPPCVVFVGELDHQTASGTQRLWALKQCGATVSSVDITQFQLPLGRYSSYWARLTQRYHLLYAQELLERRILIACAETTPSLIWFEWPRSFGPRFIRYLKMLHPNATLISFQDDNPFGHRHWDAWQWKNYLRCVPLFDIHLVKRQSDIKHLTALGARNCWLWMHGIYPPLFTPPIEHPKKLYPVSFVGTCLDERAALFEFLIRKCKLPIHIFGNHWKRRSNLPRLFPNLFHPKVSDNDYTEVIHQSIVSIALVSSSNDDEWSLRTFEIPGCAGMFLAQRTPTHETLFCDNTEAMFFSTPYECASAIRELLADTNRASQIGKAGYRRCLAENRFLQVRMQELLVRIKTLL